MVPALPLGKKNLTVKVRKRVKGEEVNAQEDRLWMLVVLLWH